MEFHEALEIAKQQPGSVVTRDRNGAFVVLGSDRRIVMPHEVFGAEGGDGAEYLQIKNELTTTKNELAQTKETVEKLRIELLSITTKLRRVSSADWDKIKEREQKERDQEQRENMAVDARRAKERRTIVCTCVGNENCSRCVGKGYYEVDGFGNAI